VEFRTHTESRSSGLIEDPQAPKEAEISVRALIRLDVLNVVEPAAGRLGQVRLRSTYEKLEATTRTDLMDPRAASDGVQLHQLEGRSIEFTVDERGTLRDIQGLEAAFPQEQSAARDLLAQLARGTPHPKAGIVPGQKWASEEPMSGAMPLRGLVRRSAFTYLRDEPCRAAKITGQGKAELVETGEMCAVIQTRSELIQQKRFRDPTPEDYRQRGLRTSGSARGVGESLACVSLQTHIVASVTQSSTEETDITVTNTDLGTRMRYTIRVRSESKLVLLTETPLAPR